MALVHQFARQAPAASLWRYKHTAKRRLIIIVTWAENAQIGEKGAVLGAPDQVPGQMVLAVDIRIEASLLKNENILALPQNVIEIGAREAFKALECPIDHDRPLFSGSRTSRLFP